MSRPSPSDLGSAGLADLHRDLVRDQSPIDICLPSLLRFDGGDESRLVEALTHLSNAHLGLRGGTLMTGSTESAEFYCRTIYAEADDGARELVSLPLPRVHCLTSPDAGVEVHRTLDMGRGLLHTDERAEWASKPTRIRSTQLLHTRHKSLALRLVTVSSAQLRPSHFGMRWDCEPKNPTRDPRGRAPTRLYSTVSSSHDDRGINRLQFEADGRTFVVSHSLQGLSTGPDVARPTDDVPGATQEFSFLEAWSLEPAGADAVLECAMPLDTLRALLRQHCESWQQRWVTSRVRLGGANDLQEGMDFAIYNLLQHDDDRAEGDNSSARGLSSSHHAGATFFDAELHKDAYWTWNAPKVARRHLGYRYRGLTAAKYLARVTQFRGARYPVAADDLGQESGHTSIVGSDGVVRAQHNVAQSLHVSANVAVSIDRFVRVTGDEEFFRSEGLEMLLEIARYSSSLLMPDGRGHLTVVDGMGPDEFHPHASDVAYTNLITQHVLRLAVRHARSRCATELRSWVTEDELDLWGRQADLVQPLSYQDGVPVQFRGYFDLADADADLVSMIDPDLAASTQVIKQADLALLATLLPHAFDADQLARLYDHYEPRTAHASSLSRIPYGTIAAWLRRSDAVLDHVRRLCRLNLDFEVDGTYTNGLHLSAYAGAWQVLFEGLLAGTRHGRCLALDPFLPTGLDFMELSVLVADCRLRINLRPRSVTITNEGDIEIDVQVEQRRTPVPPHTEVVVHLGHRPPEPSRGD